VNVEIIKRVVEYLENFGTLNMSSSDIEIIFKIYFEDETGLMYNWTTLEDVDNFTNNYEKLLSNFMDYLEELDESDAEHIIKGILD
jgi:hypothetical protein